ncbi:OmpA family protein [bacterium]|nr:OmpA family protein [bacterium]
MGEESVRFRRIIAIALGLLISLTPAKAKKTYPQIDVAFGYLVAPEEYGGKSFGIAYSKSLWGKFGWGAGAEILSANHGDTSLNAAGGFGAIYLDIVRSKRFVVRVPRVFAGFAGKSEGTSAGWSPEKFVPYLGVGAGTEFFITPQIFFGVGAEFVYGVAEKPLIAAGVSLGYRFGFCDRDRDWVDDEFDRCPGTPRHTVVDEHGCALDSDADGVFDGLDRCPGTPLAAIVDSFGCPRDSDGDGVYDGVDRCDNTPPDIPVDTTGCPRDSDHDGVPDYVDSCANTPEGAIVDLKGCPTDSDEDGVPDGIDQCQGTPTGFEVDRFGCPTIPTADGVVIYNLFDDNLQLTASAMNSLYRVARRIRAYPDRITKILIYTDTEGSPAYNRNRARKVGEKVVEFLREQGVSPELVKIVPMGEKDPIIPGFSRAAKEKDRRAKFVVEGPSTD